MFKKLKTITISLAVAFAAFAPAALPSVAYAGADIQGNLCSGANVDVTGRSTSCPTTGGSGLNDLLVKIVNIFSAIVGVIAVLMIIVGGLKYITSGGDSGNVSTAKNTIIYAIVGLVIVALAQIIVRFVLSTSRGLAG